MNVDLWMCLRKRNRIFHAKQGKIPFQKHKKQKKKNRKKKKNSEQQKKQKNSLQIHLTSDQRINTQRGARECGCFFLLLSGVSALRKMKVKKEDEGFCKTGETTQIKPSSKFGLVSFLQGAVSLLPFWLSTSPHHSPLVRIILWIPRSMI